MIIKRIHIFGYGKFENFQLDFSSGVNVLYGENEAGKSTIFSFIHAMLFGFPQRSQNTPSYEPNGGVKYGGRMTVEWPATGELTIERIKHTQGSECRLYQGGRLVGQENDLKELLKGIDRDFYESIYSFNLDGIREISRLNEEELGRYLFFAGMSGSERLWDLESGLQKQMELLFKPGGKKPELNQKLAELKESTRQLQKAKEKENEYNQLLDKQVRLSSEIAEQRSRSAEIKSHLIHLKDWKRLLPSIQELSGINARLSELRERPFPAGGMKRMDALEAERVAKATLLKMQLTKLSALKEERQKLAYNEYWPQREAEVLQMERILDHCEIQEEELRAKAIELNHLDARMYKLQEELHMNLEEDTISTLDTSVFRKEEIKQLELEMSTLKKRKSELDFQFEQERLKLDQAEKTLELYESKLLPDEERARLEERNKTLRSTSDSANAEEVRETLERLKNRREKIWTKEQKMRKKQERITNLAGALLILTALLVMYSGNMLLGAGIGIIGVLVIFVWRNFLGSQTKSGELDEEILFYEEKLAGFSSRAERQGDHGLPERLLMEDAENRLQYEREKYRKEQQDEIFEGLIQAFEKWEQEKQACERRLTALGDEWFIPQEISKSMLSEAFERLESMKDIILEKNKLQASMIEAHQAISAQSNALKNLGEVFHVSTEQPKRDIYRQIKQKLDAAIQARNERNRLDERIADLIEETEPLEEISKQLQAEQAELIKEAGCDSITDFYQLGKEFEEREQLITAKRQLMIQLGAFSDSDHYLNTSAAELDAQIENAEADSLSVEQQIEAGHQELAKVQYDCQRLEEDGTVEALQHRHQQLLEDFQVLSSKWAKLAVAKGILEETIKKYKNERFPAILERSNEHLRYLTNGKYERLVFSSEGTGLMLQDSRGGFVHARDLSRGTAELAYVSIRLALALTIEGRKDLPIMMDDTFVNFDDQRTERVLSLLKQIGQDGQQILFMTCHQKIKEQFTAHDVITIAR